MPKACFILSHIGGPRMLSSVFSGNVQEDVAYVVIQRMAQGGLLDILVECLREELNRKTVVAGSMLALQPGTIHFLPNERNYVVEGERVKAVELGGSPRLSLDHFFASVAGLEYPCAVVVLSGLLTDRDGLAGLTRLSAAGVPIFGTLESHTPVFDMIEQLRGHKLMGELYPPKYLLEHLRFREAVPEARGPFKFLIADDEPNIRAIIGELLNLEGVACEYAADGLDALRKIQKSRYDALLLDLSMPEMDGLKTLEALKTIDPKLPIIVLTGLDDPAKISAAKEFNVLGVLQKPFTLDKIKKLIPKIAKK